MKRVLVAVCIAAAVFPPLAQAHARLVHSDPAGGAVMARAISNDGHTVQGVLAFEPVARSRTTDTIERWLFLLGVLLTGGVATFRYSALRSASRVIPALLVAGFVLCIAGAVPLSRAANGSATRFGLVLEIATGIAVLGALLAALALRLPALLPVAALAAVALLPLPTLSGHALDSGQPFYAPVADMLHVVAAAIWLGGLVALAAMLTFDRGRAAEQAGRRFSTIALAAVLVVAASGLVRALTEFSSVHQLWTTTYGRALIVKSALLAVLVVVVWFNRARLRRPVVLAEIGVLAALLLAVGVLTGSRPGVREQAAVAAPPATGPIVLPPPGVLTLAAQNVRKAITIAVQRAGSGTEVTVSVIGPDGLAANGLPVLVNGVGAAVCGSGCYRVLVPGRPAAARVDAGTGTVVFPLHTVPGPGGALVTRAGQILERSSSTVYRDRLSSGPGHTIETLWREQAPDRLSYVIDDGAAGIVIGDRRWDKQTPKAPWVESPQSPLQLPALPWIGPLTNFQVLSSDPDGWTVAFLDRSTPAWFQARIERSTGRLKSFRMIAASHFMLDEYVAYDGKADIRPPH